MYSLLIKYEVTEEKNIDLSHIFSCFVSPIMQLSVIMQTSTAGQGQITLWLQKRTESTLVQSTTHYFYVVFMFQDLFC